MQVFAFQYHLLCGRSVAGIYVRTHASVKRTCSRNINSIWSNIGTIRRTQGANKANHFSHQLFRIFGFIVFFRLAFRFGQALESIRDTWITIHCSTSRHVIGNVGRRSRQQQPRTPNDTTFGLRTQSGVTRSADRDTQTARLASLSNFFFRFRSLRLPRLASSFNWINVLCLSLSAVNEYSVWFFKEKNVTASRALQ